MDQKTDTKNCEKEIELLRERVGDLEKLLNDLIESNKKNVSVIVKLQTRNTYLERKLYGQSTEKMPTPHKALRDKEKRLSRSEREFLKRERRKEADAKRKENREKSNLLEEEIVNIPVPNSQCICPSCGNRELDIVSEGRSTEIIEMKLSKMYRKVFLREVKSCKCGEYIVTAPTPDKVVEGGKYGPGVYANIIVGKCADSLPLNRQSKIFERGGSRIAPSVVGTMFNHSGVLLKILWERLRKHLIQREIVLGDETHIKSQLDSKGRRKKNKLHTSYIWCFIAGCLEKAKPSLIYYKYSTGRSMEVPDIVLKGFKGKILVDGYSGYNSITGLEDVERAGCMSHMRRYYFESLASYPPALDIMNLVLELYRIEAKAKEEKIRGTSSHLALRQKESVPIMEKIEKWNEEHKYLANPENPVIKAITYATNQWKSLNLYLSDPKIPIDNNLSERTLRIIAIGRKNYLFVGSHEAGENLVILQSLTATCIANGVNPEEYFKDVLIRINSHPQGEMDNLMPWNWKKYYGKKDDSEDF